MKEIREIIGELAGWASLCWNPRPTGVFDSTEAKKATDETMLALLSAIKERLPKKMKLDFKIEPPANEVQRYYKLVLDGLVVALLPSQSAIKHLMTYLMASNEYVTQMEKVLDELFKGEI